PQTLPRGSVVPGELLKAERALESRRAIGSDHRRFGNDRTAAAHRIEQRGSRFPARKREQARREVLSQRRFVRIATIAALEQWLARCVEIRGCLSLAQVHINTNVRRSFVDRWPDASLGAKAVADRVLRSQRDELEARERRA